MSKKESRFRPDKTNVAATAIDKWFDENDAKLDAMKKFKRRVKLKNAIKILFALLLMILSPPLLILLFYDNFNDWQWFGLTIILSIFTYLNSYIGALKLDQYTKEKKDLDGLEFEIFVDNRISGVKILGVIVSAFLTFIAVAVFYPGLEVLMLYSDPKLLYFYFALMIPYILAYLLLLSWMSTWDHYRIPYEK